MEEYLKNVRKELDDSRELLSDYKKKMYESYEEWQKEKRELKKQVRKQTLILLNKVVTP